MLIPVSSAASDPTAPGVKQWLETSLTLAQPSMTHIDVSGTLLIHKYRVGSNDYTASKMSDAYTGTTILDEGAGTTFVANMESSVRTGLSGVLAKVFPTATRVITKVDVDEATLTAARADTFTPPIGVAFTATIDRTREDVGLGTLSDAAVAAAFLSGADVANTIAFSADPGYDITYVIGAPTSPAGVSFTQLSSGAVSAEGSSVTVRVDNSRGSSVLSRSVLLHLKDPTATAPTEESISSVVDLTLGDLTEGQDSVPLNATIDTSIVSLDVKDRFPGVLPPAVTLDFLNADGLRALRQAGAVTDADLAKADKDLLASLKEDLAASLGDSTVATGALDRTDLQSPVAKPYDGSPPAKFVGHATGSHKIPGDHAKDADLALAIGARVNVDLALTARQGPTIYNLHPPAGAEFVSPRGGTVTADGKTATFTLADHASPPDLGVALQSTTAAGVTKQVADLGVLVDLKDLDVKIGQAIKGDLGTLHVDVTVTGKLNVISLPDDVRASLGDSVSIDYLSSDAVRLLVERDVITKEQLADLEAKLLDKVKSNLAGALGSDAVVTGGFDKASLSGALISKPASSQTPILFNAHASIVKPLSGGKSGAIALYTVPQTFTLPRVQGLDTTYTVVLPKGLAVTSLEAPGAEKSSKPWIDGRDSFTVKPTGESTTATVSMAVTPTFVFAKFWPIVVGLVVLLVLIVGTPIAVVVLKRRKKSP